MNLFFGMLMVLFVLLMLLVAFSFGIVYAHARISAEIEVMSQSKLGTGMVVVKKPE